MGVFWRRANHWGALAGMAAGFFVCQFYMVRTNPTLGGNAAAQWFDIAPISAAVFGVPAGLAALLLVSLLTPPPAARQATLVRHIRTPEIDEDK